MQIYILHEGFLGVFGEELKEEDFDDIEKEKFTINSSKGWLGITDKYWLTAIVPEKGKEFKAEFLAKNNLLPQLLDYQLRRSYLDEYFHELNFLLNNLYKEEELLINDLLIFLQDEKHQENE